MGAVDPEINLEVYLVQVWLLFLFGELVYLFVRLFE